MGVKDVPFESGLGVGGGACCEVEAGDEDDTLDASMLVSPARGMMPSEKGGLKGAHVVDVEVDVEVVWFWRLVSAPSRVNFTNVFRAVNEIYLPSWKPY